MSEIISNALGGIIAALFLAVIGVGTVVKVQQRSGGGKAGKNMMIVGVLMILGGLYLAGKTPAQPTNGYAIAICGLMLWLLGSVVAWYQRY